MYLIDTNVFLEMLLDQEKANESKAFFKDIDTSEFCITEFTLYSIGIVLLRLKKSALFLQWLEDMVKGEARNPTIPFNGIQKNVVFRSSTQRY